jgi:hypothetical protein
VTGPERDAAIRTASSALATLRRANATQDGPAQDALVATATTETAALLALLSPPKGKAPAKAEEKQP